MNIKIKYYIKYILILLLLPALLSFSNIDTYAKKSNKKSFVKVKKNYKKKKRAKRHYNTELNRQQAIEIIKTNSDEIANLAGLEVDGNNFEYSTADATYFEMGEDLAELEMEDDVTVDMDSFRTLWLSFVDIGKGDVQTLNGLSKKDIMNVIIDWLGTPYHFGGKTGQGIDCSAFVQRVFLSSSQLHLPRTAQEQFSIGQKINMNQLQFGDMVFFHTRRHAYASHVGIYLGDNLFAHSSSKYGVTVSSLESTYYNNRFIGARRLSVKDIVRLSLNN